MTRDEQIDEYVVSRKECKLHFHILDMRLFGPELGIMIDCPMSPDELEEDDYNFLMDLYLHLEEYEHCQVLHAAKVAT